MEEGVAEERKNLGNDSIWGYGECSEGRESTGRPEKSVKKGITGGSRRQGTRILRRDPGWGRHLLAREATGPSPGTCQTVEVSWQTGPFQPETERLPPEHSRRRTS